MTHALAIINGTGNNPGEGAIVAVVSVALVFLILGIIILITSLAGSIISKFVKADAYKHDAPAGDTWEGLDMQDDDAIAAMLVASIDYRNEIQKNVRVVKVREIK